MFQTPSLYRTPAVAMLVSQLFASRADPLKSSKKNTSPSARALFIMGRGSRPSAPNTSTNSRNTGFPIMAILLGGDAGRDPYGKTERRPSGAESPRWMEFDAFTVFEPERLRCQVSTDRGPPEERVARRRDPRGKP